MFKRNVGFRSQVYTLQFNRHRQTAETLPLLTFDYTDKRRKGSVVGGTMASAEHEPITGVWGQSGDAENARHEIAGHENAAPCCRGGKCET